jgi:hypothetical protein
VETSLHQVNYLENSLEYQTFLAKNLTIEEEGKKERKKEGKKERRKEAKKERRKEGKNEKSQRKGIFYHLVRSANETRFIN